MYDMRFALWFSQTCVHDKYNATIQCRLFMIPQTMDILSCLKDGWDSDVNSARRAAEPEAAVSGYDVSTFVSVKFVATKPGYF